MKLLLLSFLFLSSCSFMIGSKDAPKTAKGSLYTISFSDPDWNQKTDKRSDYIFENTKDGRILLSNSFCDEFQDQHLDKLAHKTFRNIKEFEAEKQEYTTYNNREAFRIQGTGVVDGVKVDLRLLNTRRDNCYFDFLAISPQGTQASEIIFKEFLQSVEFR